ncbi:MAG: DUF1801 domain-containing protein [Saprospiraceae bacterium]|nr:DUF1801 domain-containing protein [Saprospiraceae bacterium]
MLTVDDFIYQQEAKQRELLLYMHQLLTDEFELQCKIRYKIPFYDRKTWICYLNPLKNQGIELAFVRGNELSNEQGLLSSKGRKQVYGVEIQEIADIPLGSLKEVLHEAVLLDDTTPYASKR